MLETSPPPATSPVTPVEALTGAVRVQRRAELARLDAWLALRSAAPSASGWSAREEAVLHLGLSEREVASLDRVADRASALPRCVAALRSGVLGWSHLVSIVYATARVSGAALTRIDTELALHADVLVGTGRWADELLAHCDRLVTEARELRSVERSEALAERRSRVVLQPDLEGGGHLFADLDPVLFADVAEALDVAANLPTAGGDRSGDRAEALGVLCRSVVTGVADDGASRSRTSVNVVIDLTDAARPHTLGQLLSRAARGRAVRLSALLTDTLACDATVLATIVDGARPLAEFRLQDAVPADVRRAVATRDRGCRFPGCRAPVGWTDVHHVVWRSEGGDHDPDNLLLLCRRHHRRLHHPDWSVLLDPSTASVTVSGRDGRTATSLPIGRRPDHGRGVAPTR
jgi:hypothetical protein